MKTGMVCAVAALAGIGQAALAHGEGDVGLLLSGSGALTTFVANDVTGAFEDAGERVFAGELNAAGFGDGPGFFTSDGGTVPAGFAAPGAGSRIGYNTLAALKAWDGATFVDTSVRLGQDYAGSTIFTPGTDTSVSGFEFLYGGGDFDEHPDYQLDDISNAGVFLWTVEFFVRDSSGQITSTTDPVFIVFNFGVDEAVHEAAIEYAEDVLVPAPGAAAVLAVGGLLAARRRRV